jgi:hypothetical protein
MEIKITINGVERTVTKNQIFELAAKGKIRPDTNINVDGRQVAAAKIKGIVFDESSNNPTPSPTKPSAPSQQKTINNPTPTPNPAATSASSPLPPKPANDPTSVFAPLSDLPTDFPSFDFPQQELANNAAPTQSSQYSFSSRSRSHRNPNDGSGKATASLVLGICSIVFCGGLLILPLIGLVLGAFGVKSKKSGRAIAGIVMSCFGFFLALISFIVLPPAIKAAQETAQSMKCYLQEMKIATAILDFHKKHNALPARYTIDEKGKPLHSWRVLILPFLGQKELYDKIRLDEPWDSEHNQQFHSQMPSVYACPINIGEATHKCCYAAIAGSNKKGNEGALTPAKEAKLLVGTTTLTSIADNLKGILFFTEIKKPFCWMDPLADITFRELEEIVVNKNGSFHVRGTNAIAGSKDLMILEDLNDANILLEMAVRKGMVARYSGLTGTPPQGSTFPPPPEPPKLLNTLPNISAPEPRFSDPMKRNSLPIPKTNVPKPITPKKDPKPKTTTPKKEPSTTKPKTTKPEKEPRTTKPTKTTTPKKEPATPRRRTRPSKDDDTDDVAQYSAPKILS